ncbi:MAG: ABC transporter ATP-binding protein [Phascolarctobacterium sp.]|nr:ABC transporter ATP-binding protein [Phascolarctobacterium sp.]
MKNAELSLKNISKSFGTMEVVKELSLNFPSGSFTSIVGKSGCGKTTLLRLMAGLETCDSGEIILPQGKIAPVFQEPRLMPWLNVADNITFAAIHDKNLDKKRLDEILQLLELTEARNLYPHQLSGGMAQRVSLGRTLFYNPDVILMDEPFSALDYFTRHSLQETLLLLYEHEKKTIIFVTHDVEEALLLGDRILIMDKGAIKESICIDLPRPREVAQEEFQILRKKILNALY